MNVSARRKDGKAAPDLLEGLMTTVPPIRETVPVRPRNVRTGSFGVLDIGSHKVCCLIGRRDSDGELRVIGMGHREARGIRSGGIVDLDMAFASIQAAMAEAEVSGNHRVDSVTVNLSCGQPASQLYTVQWPIGGRQVGDQDIKRMVQEGARRAFVPGRECIHAMPLSFSVDDTQGVADPRAMHCEQLSARLHVVDAAGSAVSNLMSTLDRCSLGLKELVSAPLAAGLSSLVDDERQLGATVIDMGAGTTGIAVFSEGHLLYTSLLPVGGQHVTNDIARLLHTPAREAERLKTFYGNAERSPDDEGEMLLVPKIGEETDNIFNVPRSDVVAVIRPRLEEIFEMVRDRLDRSGVREEAGNGVVLTGGASQLPGTRELAARILGRQVRYGRPVPLRGLTGRALQPEFAAVVGLLLWASGEGRHFADVNLDDDRRPTFLNRIIKFLTERL